MRKNVWIGRQRAEIGLARAATRAEARLIHDEPAGHYCLRAETPPPFMLPRKQPATEGEGIALRPPAALPLPRRREPGKPDGRTGGGR